MKITKLVAIAALCAFVFIACEGPAGPAGAQGEQGLPGEQGEKGEKGEAGTSGETIITITIENGITSSSNITTAIEQAIAELALERDGSTPETALNLAFSGFSLDNDLMLKTMFIGIEDYYVNLDLSGLSGDVFPVSTLIQSVDKSQILKVTLSENVTTIADGGAFNGFTGLTEVSIPGGVTIGYNAFTFCSSLKTVDLPKAQSIGDGAFWNCPLETVSFPNVQIIGDNVFFGCGLLERLELPLVISFGNNVLGWSGTQNIVISIGSTVPVVGMNTFSYDTAKTVTVEVPKGTTNFAGLTLPAVISDNTNNWGNALRGLGWDGTDYLDGTINTNISLTIKARE